MRKFTAAATLTLALGMSSTAMAQADWLVAPYVWLSDITLKQSTGASGGVTAADLLDKSDSVGMIRIEAAQNRWGFSFDYLWLGVSDGRSFPNIPPNGVDLNSSLDTTIWDLAAVYRPSGDSTGLNFLFGMRSIDADVTLLLIPRGGGPVDRFDGGSTFNDAMGGARYRMEFGNNWDFNARADYSFGDTEGSWNLLSTVGYRFNDTFAMNLGYRHLDFRFEDNDDGSVVETDLTLSGPLLGFLFRF